MSDVYPFLVAQGSSRDDVSFLKLVRFSKSTVFLSSTQHGRCGRLSVSAYNILIRIALVLSCPLQCVRFCRFLSLQFCAFSNRCSLITVYAYNSRVVTTVLSLIYQECLTLLLKSLSLSTAHRSVPQLFCKPTFSRTEGYFFGNLFKSILAHIVNHPRFWALRLWIQLGASLVDRRC